MLYIEYIREVNHFLSKSTVKPRLFRAWMSGVSHCLPTLGLSWLRLVQ